jgi:hypothetical protein
MATTPNLQRKLQQTLGAEAAGDLVAWMQSMDASRMDMSDLRREMQAGFAKIDERFARVDERFARVDERFARVDERFARVDGSIETLQASMERTMEKGLREQTRFFFVAWSVILAAIIGLYSRT